jgi:hypothetical protein
MPNPNLTARRPDAYPDSAPVWIDTASALSRVQALKGQCDEPCRTEELGEAPIATYGLRQINSTSHPHTLAPRRQRVGLL